MSRETLVAAIPDVRDDNVTEVLRAIKNVLQVREGHLGDPLDQNVTLRDLSDLNVVTSGGATTLTNGTVVLVRNPAVLDDGYNPTKDLTTPPAPTGLTASPTFTNVYLAWNGAPYRNHAYTEIWRATTNNLGNAVLVGRSNTNLYADAAQEGQTYYYWIRFVSVANVTGPYNSTSGTSATTATNPATLVTLLTGQITESQLYSSLATRISLIDAPASVVGSVDNRLAIVQAQVNDLLNTPQYSNTVSYASGSVVTYNGGLYQANQSTVGHLPTDTTYWTKIGDYSSLGGAVAAQGTQISTLTTNLSAEVSDRKTLASQVNDPTTGLPATRASLNTNYYTKSGTDSAIAASATTLTSNFNSTLTGYVTSAKLTQDYYTKTDTNSAISAATSSLVSSTSLATTLVNYVTNSTLTNQYYTKTDTNTAISSATSGLVSSTALTTALQSYVTNAALTSNYYTKTDANTAISSATSDLVSTTALTTALSSYATNATLTTNYYTKTDTDKAISSSTSTVNARLNVNGDVYSSIVAAQNTASAKSASFVQSATPTATKVGDLWIDTGNGNLLKQWNGVSWVAADDQRVGSTASSVTQISSRLNNVTGSNNGVTMEQQFYTNASQIGGLQGQYTVKIDNNGYVTGFGLASISNNGTPTSSFIVRADSFSISNPGGPSIQPSTPFIVRTTGTTINNVYVPPGVYLSDVFIQNGTITDAKIATLTADKITTGTLNASVSVNTGLIYGGVSDVGYAIGTSNFGTGFLLGSYGGAYQFFVGSPTQNVSWNGSSLNIKGVVYAQAGAIGSNIIDTNGIHSSNYVSGSAGWALNNNGSAEFSNAIMRGMVNGGNFTAYAWPSSGTGFHLSSSGLLLGNANTSSYFQVTGDGNVYTPNFSVINGSATFSGLLSAAKIAVGTNTNSVSFIDVGSSSVDLSSTASGYFQFTGDTSSWYTDAYGDVYFLGAIKATSSNVQFTCGDGSVNKPNRVRSGTVRFIVSSTGSVDVYLSIWYRVGSYGTFGNWQFLARSIEPQDSYGACATSALLEINMSYGSTVQFGMSACDQNGNFANYGKTYIYDGNMTVFAANF
jgi:hypothetical protein